MVFNPARGAAGSREKNLVPGCCAEASARSIQLLLLI
jgi:hypothetical protein